jgi:hypothetical protein
MNSINKTAGLAGFLYFIYWVIHIFADASQQKNAGAKSGHKLLTAGFSARSLGKEMQMKTISSDQNKIQQRKRN